MIAFIKGSLAETGTDYVVLDNQGIGYLIYTPSSVLEELPALGQTVKMYTYMYVREDQMSLYGFLTRDDLHIFKLLIGVSGIGPKGALGILSTISPNTFRFAVMAGDARAIAKAPGIGPKTAQKLIIELKDKLDEAVNIQIDSNLLTDFHKEIVNANRLVYFTDNCGEIVTDRLLIATLRDINPDLYISVIVRGKPVLNDATLEDAKYVHMEDVAQKVIGNGTGMPGNVIGAISQEAMDEVENADLLISKGQGNFEGLSGCGLNIYYFFLCKCEMFMRRFGVEQFTGIMTKE